MLQALGTLVEQALNGALGGSAAECQFAWDLRHESRLMCRVLFRGGAPRYDAGHRFCRNEGDQDPRRPDVTAMLKEAVAAHQQRASLIREPHSRAEVSLNRMTAAEVLANQGRGIVAMATTADELMDQTRMRLGGVVPADGPLYVLREQGDDMVASEVRLPPELPSAYKPIERVRAAQLKATDMIKAGALFIAEKGEAPDPAVYGAELWVFGECHYDDAAWMVARWSCTSGRWVDDLGRDMGNIECWMLPPDLKG